MHRVTLIPGDGIGPEVTSAARRVVAATGVDIDWQTELVGEAAMAEYGKGQHLPQRLFESVRKNRVALKGPTATPMGNGYRSINVELRQKLDLFANLRPIKSILGSRRRYDSVDLVVFRENTEDLFCGIENVIQPGVVVAMKLVTEKASLRIARSAFEYARANGRKKVTAGHKATIMKLSDGLFLDCCRAVAKEYPSIEYAEVLVDSMCTQLVMNPDRFDVIVLQNLYGDMISDLCAGLIGGLGVAPGGNIGADMAVFECVHGTAPDIAGKGIANPMATILSSAMMLDYLKEPAAAARIRRAVTAVAQEAATLTPDLGGKATTSSLADAIAARV